MFISGLTLNDGGTLIANECDGLNAYLHPRRGVCRFKVRYDSTPTDSSQVEILVDVNAIGFNDLVINETHADNTCQ